MGVIRIIIPRASRDGKHGLLFLSYRFILKTSSRCVCAPRSHFPKMPHRMGGFRKLRAPVLYLQGTLNVVPLKSLGVLSRHIIVVQDIGF